MRARMAGRRPPSIALVAAACAGAGAWFSAGALAVIDAGPGAPRAGILPPWWLLAALVILAVAAAWLARLPRERAWPLFFPLIAIVPWLPGPLPLAALVWTGPIAAIVWTVTAIGATLAGPTRLAPRVAAVLSHRVRAPIAAGLIAFALYAGAAAHRSFELVGDEPHYLVITQSLLHDFDLRIENNHRAGQFTSYVRGELKPHYLRRGRDGQIYSIHAPGLPVLLAPAFAFFGHYGAIVFLALVCAAAGALVWTACAIVSERASAAWFGWAAVMLTVPFFFQAFAIYPEAAGAAAVMCGVFALLDRAAPVHRWFWYGAALAVLPWLHTRLSIPAGVLGAAILLRLARRADRGRAIARFLAAPIVSAAAWFAYFQVVYGSLSPASPYGGQTQSGAGNIGHGLTGLLLDQQFGILPHAPVVIVALAGLLPLARRQTRLASEILCVILPYALVTSSYHMWWGGRSAPGRLLAAVILPLALPAALMFDRARSAAARALMVLALAVSVAITAILLGPEGGRLIFNPRDGFALWLEWIAPLVDLPRAAPSVLRDGPLAALVDAAIWMAALGAAAVLVVRARGLATRSPGKHALMTCAAMALAVSMAVAVVWRRHGVAGPAATTAQLAVLRQAVRAPRGVAIKFSPLQRVSLDAVVGRFDVAASERRPRESDAPVMTLAGVPAGDYRVRVSRPPRVAGTLQARAGGTGFPFDTWPLTGQERDLDLRLTLPVPMDVLALLVDPPAPERLELTLRPAGVARPPIEGGAIGGARYGRTRAFLMTGSAYFESTGVWLSAGDATIGFDPPVRALFLRNTNLDNVVTVEASGIAERLELRSREERTITLPPSAEAYGVIQVTVREGVVPAIQEPGSADFRNLGVWLEVRD